MDIRKNSTLAALLAGFALCILDFGSGALAGPGSSPDTPEQTAPQGEDPPGAENGGPKMPPPADHKGVIPPPDIGDEDIHTEVPNPEAGHEEEVIPPSDVAPQQPQQDGQETQR